MLALLLIEILAMPAEQSRGRHNSRVVKRKMSNFPTKARAAPSSGRPGLHYAKHIQIVAPAMPASPPLAAKPLPIASATGTARSRPHAARDAARQSFRLEHVRAWRTSKLTRMAYCQRHNLKPRSFDTWVARLLHRFRHGPSPVTKKP
jgi:hypothetical protein